MKDYNYFMAKRKKVEENGQRIKDEINKLTEQAAEITQKMYEALSNGEIENYEKLMADRDGVMHRAETMKTSFDAIRQIQPFQGEEVDTAWDEHMADWKKKHAKQYKEITDIVVRLKKLAEQFDNDYNVLVMDARQWGYLRYGYNGRITISMDVDNEEYDLRMIRDVIRALNTLE